MFSQPSATVGEGRAGARITIGPFVVPRELNDELIDAGTIKPTQMVAAMRATPCPSTRVYKHWTPQFCVRPPS